MLSTSTSTYVPNGLSTSTSTEIRYSSTTSTTSTTSTSTSTKYSGPNPAGRRSRLLQHQEQSAVEPETCFIQNPLYGSLGQQGIHGLLEILAAAPGAESDAVMGELRSMLKV